MNQRPHCAFEPSGLLFLRPLKMGIRCAPNREFATSVIRTAAG